MVAHRVAWMLANKQDIPDGMVVMHTCDNSLCVRPYHLKLGTQADNIWDRDIKGRQRTGDKRGEKHHLNKLTDADVIELRELYSRGTYKQTDLAKRFGIGQDQVSRIINRKAWDHV